MVVVVNKRYITRVLPVLLVVVIAGREPEPTGRKRLKAVHEAHPQGLRRGYEAVQVTPQGASSALSKGNAVPCDKRMTCLYCLSYCRSGPFCDMKIHVLTVFIS